MRKLKNKPVTFLIGSRYNIIARFAGDYSPAATIPGQPVSRAWRLDRLGHGGAIGL